MINEKMESALNEQVNKELYSSYMYLQMGMYFESVGLRGFANWMKVQSKEENFHACKIYEYIINRGGKVILEAIQKPPSEYNSVMEVFQKTLEHEVYVTSSINSLMDIAHEVKDRATISFLNWFIDEQVEEEASVEEIISELKLVDCSKDTLFMMDREMASRVYSEPV